MANNMVTTSDVGGAGDVLRHIRNLFLSGHHSDFTVTAKDDHGETVHYHLHKNILRNNGFFRQAIENKTFTEAENNAVDMSESGDDAKAFEYVLKHLYGHTYPVSRDGGLDLNQNIEVYLLAQKYGVATLELQAVRAAKLKLELEVAREQVPEDIIGFVTYVWENTPDNQGDVLRESILEVATHNWGKLFGSLKTETRQEFIVRCPSFIDSVTMRLLGGGPVSSVRVDGTSYDEDQDEDGIDMDSSYGGSRRYARGGGRRLG